MIKEVILQDFFSFRGENRIKLNTGLNLLLGINGSGKTTFLNAFRLLYEGVVGIGFEKLFQDKWGGFINVANANQIDRPSVIKLTFVFDHIRLKDLTPISPFNNSDAYYEITIKPIGSTGYSLEERLYTTHKKNAKKQFEYLNFKDGRGQVSVYHSDGVKTEHEDFGDSMSSQELFLRQINDPRRYLPSHTIKTAIAAMAIYDTFDISSGSNIRKPSVYNTSMRLSYNGENLGQVLSNLRMSDTFSFQSIEDALKDINPNFLSFDFQPYGPQLYMSLRERNLNHSIGAQHISDGTLKFILLASVLKNRLTGRFVGIDEPESRLHPDMINSVAEMLREMTRYSQLLVATHSPLLLNAFCLDDVLVFEKNDDNATIVKRYSEADFEDYGADILPGQLWLCGQIGGKRW